MIALKGKTKFVKFVNDRPSNPLLLSRTAADAIRALLVKIFGANVLTADIALRRHDSKSPTGLYVTVTKRVPKTEGKETEFWSEVDGP